MDVWIAHLPQCLELVEELRRDPPRFSRVPVNTCEAALRGFMVSPVALLR
jgi:hypothetical protein